MPQDSITAVRPPGMNRQTTISGIPYRARDWAERSLARYGMPLIVVCRFIPGGRTAVMLSCGIARYGRRRFIIATAIAGVIWACYSFFLGRLGGKAFEDKPWAGLLIAFGGTLAVSGLIELVRRLRARRARRLAEEQGQAGAQGQADAQGQAGAQGQGDRQDRGRPGQANAQGRTYTAECGTPSPDDAPRTPVR